MIVVFQLHSLLPHDSAASQNAEGAVHIIRYTASELFSFSSSIIKQSEECAFRGESYLSRGSFG